MVQSFQLCVTFVKLNPIRDVRVCVCVHRMYRVHCTVYTKCLIVNKLHGNMVDNCKDSKSINMVIEAGDMVKLMGNSFNRK